MQTKLFIVEIGHYVYIRGSRSAFSVRLIWTNGVHCPGPSWRSGATHLNLLMNYYLFTLSTYMYTMYQLNILYHFQIFFISHMRMYLYNIILSDYITQSVPLQNPYLYCHKLVLNAFNGFDLHMFELNRVHIIDYSYWAPSPVMLCASM